MFGRWCAAHFHGSYPQEMSYSNSAVRRNFGSFPSSVRLRNLCGCLKWPMSSPKWQENSLCQRRWTNSLSSEISFLTTLWESNWMGVELRHRGVPSGMCIKMQANSLLWDLASPNNRHNRHRNNADSRNRLAGGLAGWRDWLSHHTWLTIEQMANRAVTPTGCSHPASKLHNRSFLLWTVH